MPHKDPEIARAYHKKYREINKDKLRDRHYRIHYNISLEDYNKMFAKQEGKCAICKTHQSELKESLAVDHRHSDGKVRKLLCKSCNIMIGESKENIDTLKEAIKYLEENYG